MVTIQKNGNAVQFTFDDSSQYLYNGTIDVPVNSLSLVIDESDLVTFKKAFSNDIFLSVHLDELGMSRQQVIELYKSIMVGATGGGGSGSGMTPEEVQELIDESISALTEDIDSIEDALSGKADTSALTPIEEALEDCFDGAEYDAVAKRINFKHGNAVKGYIDATAFIKDGMVDSVAIVSGKLVITFNTDSGKENIEISLTDIFNPANYYTKGETDAIVDAATSGKADASAVTSIESALATKEDATAHSADIAAVNAAIAQKADASEFTAHITDTTLHVTTQDRLRWNSVSGKADTTAVTAIEQALSGKADTSAVTAAIADYTYDKDTIDEKVAQGGTFDPTQYYTKTDTDGKIHEAVSGKAETTAVTAVNDALTAHTANTAIHVTAQDKAAWNAKADAADIPSVVNYFDGAVYDSNTKRINFKHGETVKSYIDATDFIKDGMVDGVELSGTDLVITFNTDSGKENIVIDTTAIFNPSNYYTKAQTDSAIDAATSGKADTSAVTAISESLTGKADTTAVTASLATKQNRLTAGSGISIVNDTINVTADTGSANIVSITQAEYDALATKDPDTLYVISDADPIDVYSKAETDAKLALKANQSAMSGKADTSAVTAVEQALSGKQDTLIAGAGIEISGNTISATGGGGMSDEVEQLIAAAFNDIDHRLDHKLGQAYANSVTATYATKTELSGVNDSIDSKIAEYGYSKKYIDGKELIISSALNDLKKNSGGASVVVDDAMSGTSTNPVQNMVVKAYIDALESRIASLESQLQGVQQIIDSING